MKRHGVRVPFSGNASTTAFVQIHLPPVSVFRGRYFVTDIFHTGLHNTAPAGTPVVQLRPEDEEAAAGLEDGFGWRFVYSLTGGNDNQLFQVDPRTGMCESRQIPRCDKMIFQLILYCANESRCVHTLKVWSQE